MPDAFTASPPSAPNPADPENHALLEALAAQYPTLGSALAEVAGLKATLRLPKRVVHVISDVHGEAGKLRHVINNASGSIRPLVHNVFRGRLSEREMRRLLSVIYYPQEFIDMMMDGPLADDHWRRRWTGETLRHQFEIIRMLSRNYRLREIQERIPADYHELFMELLGGSSALRVHDYLNEMLDALAAYGRDLSAVRAASRLVRNLAISELIVAGDLGDRGPRVDRVIDYLQQQPHVSIVWGNHDVDWMGACLGQEALIATVLRFSLRYRRLFQLEEGYGLLLLPLEQLARKVYADDPAELFYSKQPGMRDPLLVARMQKAIAILEQKLIGETTRRHPEWELEHRNLLHRIDHREGTVEVDGTRYPLRDRYLPTIAPEADPYELTMEERECMDRLRESFITSPRLWQHMKWVVSRGSMYTVRDRTAIFHACVPVDEAGEPLSLEIEGHRVAGRAMMDAFDTIIRRAYRAGADRARQDDLDWFYYLWSGPCSPLFGKDRMTTFENYFIEAEETHVETRNPYFQLVHEAEFCRRIGADFGVKPDENMLIVNGHVPVKVEKGEKPVKDGGNAVTIDGAFSEAYGDRGYTLVLSPEDISLAEHHHFESIRDVLENDADIVPTVQRLREFHPHRLRGDTEEGTKIRQRIAALEKLIEAYRQGVMAEG